jgi:hypothetical protein
MYFMRTLMRIGMASGLSCKVVITKVIKAFVFASPFQSIKCISNFNIVGNCCSLSSKQRKQGVLMNIPMMFFFLCSFCASKWKYNKNEGCEDYGLLSKKMVSS